MASSPGDAPKLARVPASLVAELEREVEVLGPELRIRRVLVPT